MYSKGFFANRRYEAALSAEVLSPIILAYVRAFLGAGGPTNETDGSADPMQMIDVGCGDGSWIDAFRKEGLTCWGLDGPWSPCADAIKLDMANARLAELEGMVPDAVDFILCLEFLEHLPADAAEGWLEWMAGRSRALVLSAAVPWQGGTGHINEQWPDYWQRKLSRLGYTACDGIRPLIWNDRRVAPWYRQNVVLYFRGDPGDRVSDMSLNAWRSVIQNPLAMVHPDVMLRKKAWRLAAWLGL